MGYGQHGWANIEPDHAVPIALVGEYTRPEIN
jgi:hypothetical protein